MAAPHPPLTFVQPVAQAVVDHALLPSGDHADGLLPHMRTVVDVVLKDEDLVGKRRKPRELRGARTGRLTL